MQTDTSAELIAGISYGEDADAALYSDVPFEKVSSDKGVALELSRKISPIEESKSGRVGAMEYANSIYSEAGTAVTVSKDVTTWLKSCPIRESLQ